MSKRSRANYRDPLSRVLAAVSEGKDIVNLSEVE
jgi:hypothetical protein